MMWSNNNVQADDIDGTIKMDGLLIQPVKADPPPPRPNTTANNGAWSLVPIPCTLASGLYDVSVSMMYVIPGEVPVLGCTGGIDWITTAKILNHGDQFDISIAPPNDRTMAFTEPLTVVTAPDWQYLYLCAHFEPMRALFVGDCPSIWIKWQWSSDVPCVECLDIYIVGATICFTPSQDQP